MEGHGVQKKSFGCLQMSYSVANMNGKQMLLCQAFQAFQLVFVILGRGVTVHVLVQV